MATLLSTAGSLTINALEQKHSANVLEFSAFKNFPIVTFLGYEGGEVKEESYVVVLKHRQNFVPDESPQVTITASAVKRAENVANEYPIGTNVGIAFSFVVDGEDAEGKYTDIIFVPKEIHEKFKVRGGVFSIGDRGGNFHYRRDRFDEALNLEGVEAVRMRYKF